MTKRHVFDFTLVTLGPVHIGSGETHTLKEVAYYKGYYYFPNMGEIYKKLATLGFDKVVSFENYLTSYTRGNEKQQRLNTFLERQKVLADIQQFGGYRIKNIYTRHQDPLYNKSITNVSAFIKDPYYQPYIPGSSLKGALRSVIENTHHLLNKELSTLFRHIQVSDSEPVSFERLGIVPKIDFNPKNKKISQLDAIYREAILPGTRINFTITTTGSKAYQVIKHLINYTCQDYEGYSQKILASLPIELRVRGDLRKLKHIFYIGGGSGFWTKVNFNNSNVKKPPRMNGLGVIKYSHLPYYYLQLSQGRRIPLFHTYEQSNKVYNLYEMGKCSFMLRQRNN